MTPPAASRPKAEPPDRTKASTCSTIISGSSNAVSRTAGAPPLIAIEATAGSSKTTAVTPEAMRSSSADPTRTPATSVIRFAVIWKSFVSPAASDYRNPFGKVKPLRRSLRRASSRGQQGGGEPPNGRVLNMEDLAPLRDEGNEPLGLLPGLGPRPVAR